MKIDKIIEETNNDNEITVKDCYVLLLSLMQEYAEDRAKKERVEPSEIQNKIIKRSEAIGKKLFNANHI